MHRLATALVITLSLLALPLRADEAADALAKQKEIAVANWKKLELGDPVVVETDSLLVYTTYPAKLVKPLAETVEKHHAVAAKALKFGDEDKLWAGKLTVYLFAERPIYASFVRRVEGKSPDRDQVGSNRFGGDTPFVAVSVTPDKDGSLSTGPVSTEVASVLIRRKGGSPVQVPGWLQEGFGQAVVWRAKAPTASRKTGNPKWGGVIKARSAKELWGGSLSTDDEAAFGAQFADYWVFGPGSETFPMFLNSLKPGERGQPPSIPMALEAGKQPLETFDKAWKKYNGQ